MYLSFKRLNNKIGFKTHTHACIHAHTRGHPHAHADAHTHRETDRQIERVCVFLLAMSCLGPCCWVKKITIVQIKLYLNIASQSLH